MVWSWWLKGRSSPATPRQTGQTDAQAPRRSGQAAEIVTKGLQSLMAGEVYPLVIGPWARGGNPTAVDHQLGMAYGAGAVQVLKAGHTAVMVAFVPPDIKFVPLAEAMDTVRTVPPTASS